MINSALLAEIEAGFPIDWDGRHGGRHMKRVLDNGLRVAELTGANQHVVALFAYFHDAKRLNNAIDPGHGERGAELAKTMRGKYFDLPNADFEMLLYACAHHTSGWTDGPVTVQTCWDADRLDLGRIGIRPNPKYLCTDAAKLPEIIDWAYLRSRDGAEKNPILK